MSFDPQPFRQQYRAAIRPGYNPWLHAGFVLAYGGAWIVFFLSRLEQPSLLEWLTVPAALVFFNWGEYRIHKSLGHHKHPLGRTWAGGCRRSARTKHPCERCRGTRRQRRRVINYQCRARGRDSSRKLNRKGCEFHLGHI